MPFIIETWDRPGHQHVRQQARAEHLKFLEEIAPLLIACGAKLNDDGSDAGLPVLSNSLGTSLAM